jgi:hypothetical protein
MISPESRRLLEELSHSSYGKALREFLDERFAEIGNIRASKSWEETLGRGFALTLLEELFSFMGEKSSTTNKKTPYT